MHFPNGSVCDGSCKITIRPIVVHVLTETGVMMYEPVVKIPRITPFTSGIFGWSILVTAFT